METEKTKIEDEVQKGTQYLCIQNKLLYAHVSSVGKDIARDKDGYSVQLAEWERGDRGELFAVEPAPCRVVWGVVPHPGVPAAWPRSPGHAPRWVPARPYRTTIQLKMQFDIHRQLSDGRGDHKSVPIFVTLQYNQIKRRS